MTPCTRAGRGIHYTTADLDNAVKQVLPIHVRTKKCPGAATSLFHPRQLARRAVQRSLGSIVTLADPLVPDGPNQRLSNCMVRRARQPAAMCDTFVTDCTLSLTHKVLRHGEPGSLAAVLQTNSEARERNTRQDCLLRASRSKTEAGKRRFSSRAPSLYNRLPPEMK